MIKQNIKKINSYIAQEQETTLTMFTTMITALEHRTAEPLDKIIHEYEEHVNALEIKTTQCCIQTLALYQPEAKFLRIVVTGLQISYAIERIADVIVNTAKIFQPIIHKKNLACHEEFNTMMQFIVHMIDDSIHAFFIGDSNKARTIFTQDKEVNAMRDNIINAIMHAAKSDAIDIAEAVAITQAAQNMERVGDITTTIAKHVVYLKDGEVIEHN